MSGPLTLAAYTLGQTARIGVYWGQYLMTARMTRPPKRKAAKAKRTPAGAFPKRAEVLRDLQGLLRRDWENIARGLYRPPHDLLEAPLEGMSLAGRYFRDLRRVERRRHAGGHGEVRAGLAERAAEFPSYYLQNFHFQTDGWLSRDSAALYDHQVEVLFTGGADAMRRMALVPLARFLRGRRQAQCRMIDVACGTGRFLTFVKDNFPRLSVTALDLSPDYLDQARANLRPWRGVDFVRAAAEATGLPEESHDLATCVYLFHELPPRVRPLVAFEIARLLKPGGLLILVDSLQKGDNPSYDGLLDQFPVSFHEPYYSSYVRCDLESLFADAGLIAENTEIAFFSRIMTFRKPGGHAIK